MSDIINSHIPHVETAADRDEEERDRALAAIIAAAGKIPPYFLKQEYSIIEAHMAALYSSPHPQFNTPCSPTVCFAYNPTSSPIAATAAVVRDEDATANTAAADLSSDVGIKPSRCTP